jgi:urease accessory protein
MVFGQIDCVWAENKATLVKLLDGFPLKLLSPKSHNSSLLVCYQLSYGGGLLGGDLVELSITVGSKCCLTLLNPGSTKVFKSKSSLKPSCQFMEAHIKTNALLSVLPEPVTCFSGSRYRQKQRFHLEKSSSLVLLDWFTSGRKSRGEEWQFDHYFSENRIIVDGDIILNDSFMLEKINGFIGGVGNYSCYATLILIGERTLKARMQLKEKMKRIVISKNSKQDFIWCCSEIPNGLIIRASSMETFLIREFITESLAVLVIDIGDGFSKI